jgi:prolyl 4-hydroxylase
MTFDTEIHNLPVRINRANPIWQAAISCLDPGLLSSVQPACFTYWDTYGQSAPDLSGLADGARIFSLVPRSISNALADKRQLARMLTEKNLDDIAPPTFESIPEACRFDELNVPVWFIKNAFGTAGQGMRCVSAADLSRAVLPENHIVQAGVQDLLLIEGRKFTTRIYALLWNRTVYLYDNGFLVIHGVPYDPSSTDYKVQIEHAGYERPDSPVKLREFQRFEGYGHYYGEIRRLLRRLTPAMQPVVNATDEQAYLLLGIDVIFQSSGRVHLLEINTIPNFIHTAEINQAVNVPLFRAVLEKLLGRPSAELLKIG